MLLHTPSQTRDADVSDGSAADDLTRTGTAVNMGVDVALACMVVVVWSWCATLSSSPSPAVAAAWLRGVQFLHDSVADHAAWMSALPGGVKVNRYWAGALASLVRTAAAARQGMRRNDAGVARRFATRFMCGSSAQHDSHRTLRRCRAYFRGYRCLAGHSFLRVCAT